MEISPEVERLNCRLSEPSYSAQYFLTVVPLPEVVEAHAVISVQSAPTCGEIVGVPAASTVTSTRSLLPRLSDDEVPVGSVPVTEVAEAVACVPER